MVELYKRFTHSIAWNTLESVVYQLCFLAHQLLLFSVTDRTTYGLIGTFFSITYLIVTITNCGLDVSVAPFFTIITQSKDQFKKFFLMQLVPELCIVTTLFLAAMIKHIFFSSLTLPCDVGTPFLIILGTLVFFEGAKKTLRMILHLAFLNDKTTFVEIANIIMYVSLVWTSYLLGNPISLYLIFIPMLIVSATSCLMLFVFVYDYYATLPDKSTSKIEIGSLQWRILQSRFFNFFNQISHMIFSSNFLVPFFALFFGLHQAGVLKLLASITHSITTIVQKAFGISSNILLSHIKDESDVVKKNIFFMITNHLNQVIYGILLFFIINHKTIMGISAIANTGTTWSIAYLFMFISFSETFFIAYENFFITHEKAGYLFLFNMIIMSIVMCIMMNMHLFSQLMLLLAIIAVRIFAFSTLGLLSFYQWRIKPALAINPRYFFCSFLISITFYVLALMV